MCLELESAGVATDVLSLFLEFLRSKNFVIKF